MSFWILIALAAQFLNASVTLLDKYLIASKSVSRPVVYAFYISILSGVTVAILPFGLVGWPTLNVIWLSLATAFAYVFSILFLYKSLALADASDVAPVMGAMTAIATLFFSSLILSSGLTSNFLSGFVLLTAGTVLMSYFRFNWRSAFYVLLAGILFGLSSVIVKMVFNETDFWTGFFWSRMGNVAGAVFLLAWPDFRRAILQNISSSSAKTKFLVVANKALAGLAFLFILLAISLGDVSVVNAIGGTQFVFLILFALLFTKKFPNYFFESIHKPITVVQKAAATILIVVGYFVLFV